MRTTPITDMIERYERALIEFKNFTATTEFEIGMMVSFINDLKQQLPKEKEEIELSSIDGYNNACADHCVQPLEIQSISSSDKYFTQTFNQ